MLEKTNKHKGGCVLLQERGTLAESCTQFVFSVSGCLWSVDYPGGQEREREEDT